MRRVALHDDHTGEQAFVVLSGDEGRPASEVVNELRMLAPGHSFTANGQPLREQGTAEDLGLFDGDVIAIGTSMPPRVVLPPTGLVLRVVGGPDAGLTVPVRAETTVGRSSKALLRLRDEDTSRDHAVFERTEEGVFVRDAGSMNGTFLEGREITREKIAIGDVVRVGNSLIELDEADADHIVQLASSNGTRGFFRGFRSGMRRPPDSVRFPQEENVGEKPGVNLLLTILPGVGFGAMALFSSTLFGRGSGVAGGTLWVFALLSPLLSLARTFVQRRQHKKKKESAETKYSSETSEALRELDEARAAERRYQRHQIPDMARVVEAALQPTRELWSRRPDDPDVLTLRVGSAPMPSQIRIEGKDPDDPVVTEPQPWMPVGINLPSYGGLALVGPLERLRPLGCAAVLQLAVLHAPSELKIVVLGGADAAEHWQWVRWLPHLRESRSDPFIMVGSDPASRAQRIEELRRILGTRREQATTSRDASDYKWPAYVVVYDNVSERIREGVSELLSDGPAHGIYAITLDAHQVPDGCQASVDLGQHADLTEVKRRGEPTVTDVILDAVTPGRCDEVARRLSAIDLVGTEESTALPRSVRLLDIMGMEAAPGNVAESWKRHSPSTRAPMGVGSDGTVELDLTRDGPHALVAGTTRSGKSEFIKTWVASLALVNHPDDLAFLFIDFKGGGDYQTLENLPHAVDLSTSLDDESVFDRTLQLLDAELGRRQALVIGARAASIEGYHAARRADDPPLPRLVVIVDEFAELRDRRPDQLDKLVSVARTGAAFGIHLLLATQRPTGVVTGQIDANVGLRVCFRVKDAQESREVIGAPDAGSIAEHHRGRCFLRSHASPLTEVQSARVAGARPGSVAAEPIRAHVVPWEELGRPPLETRAIGEVPDPETDLWDVVEACRAASEASGWTEPAVPWPPMLEDSIPLSSVNSPPDGSDQVILGAIDDPDAQRRVPLAITFGEGHVAFAGSARTGRTTALRTFLVSMAARMSPADAHVAVLDFGGGKLRAAGQLPHCYGVAVDDWQLTERLLGEMEDVVAQRRDAFASNGWPDLRAQRRTSQDPMPWLVLMIDGWDALADEGARLGVPDRIATLISRGSSLGVQALIAGEKGTASGAIGRHLTHRYVLRFNRVIDAELQGIRARRLPRVQPPGRVVEVRSGRLGHIAELDDAKGSGQGAIFAVAVQHLAAYWKAQGFEDAPRKIRPLPDRVPLDELIRQGAPREGAELPILVGMAQRRNAFWVDLVDADGTFFVVGPRGSGRSTALLSFATSALTRKVDVIAIAPRRSPLVRIAGLPGVRAVLEDASELGTYLQPQRPVLIVVDDISSLEDAEPIERAVRNARLGEVGVIGASLLDRFRDELRGLGGLLRRGRAGIILSPSATSDGTSCFGMRLADSMVFDGPPGRGVAGLSGEVSIVQVPIVPLRAG